MLEKSKNTPHLLRGVPGWMTRSGATSSAHCGWSGDHRQCPLERDLRGPSPRSCGRRLQLPIGPRLPAPRTTNDGVQCDNWPSNGQCVALWAKILEEAQASGGEARREARAWL